MDRVSRKNGMVKLQLPTNEEILNSRKFKRNSPTSFVDFALSYKLEEYLRKIASQEEFGSRPMTDNERVGYTQMWHVFGSKREEIAAVKAQEAKDIAEAKRKRAEAKKMKKAEARKKKKAKDDDFFSTLEAFAANSAKEAAEVLKRKKEERKAKVDGIKTRIVNRIEKRIDDFVSGYGEKLGKILKYDGKYSKILNDEHQAKVSGEILDKFEEGFPHFITDLTIKEEDKLDDKKDREEFEKTGVWNLIHEYDGVVLDRLREKRKEEWDEGFNIPRLIRQVERESEMTMKELELEEILPMFLEAQKRKYIEEFVFAKISYVSKYCREWLKMFSKAKQGYKENVDEQSPYLDCLSDAFSMDKDELHEMFKDIKSEKAIEVIDNALNGGEVDIDPAKIELKLVKFLVYYHMKNCGLEPDPDMKVVVEAHEQRKQERKLSQEIEDMISETFISKCDSLISSFDKRIEEQIVETENVEVTFESNKLGLIRACRENMKQFIQDELANVKVKFSEEGYAELKRKYLDGETQLFEDLFLSQLHEHRSLSHTGKRQEFISEHFPGVSEAGKEVFANAYCEELKRFYQALYPTLGTMEAHLKNELDEILKNTDKSTIISTLSSLINLSSQEILQVAVKSEAILKQNESLDLHEAIFTSIIEVLYAKSVPHKDDLD